jgi:hypothetical protein
VANLSAEDIDWRAKVVSFSRHKTSTASIIGGREPAVWIQPAALSPNQILAIAPGAC